MDNLTKIQMTPTQFNNDTPITWDITFLDENDPIGSIEKCEDGFMVITTFNDAFIADDSDDLKDLLIDLFCPTKIEIN